MSDNKDIIKQMKKLEDDVCIVYFKTAMRYKRILNLMKGKING